MKTQLSPIISGTMSWGAWDKKLTPAQMSNLIHVCVEHGITSFDHADVYGDYTTEAEFGEALAHGKIGRDKIQLITKLGVQQVVDSRANRIKHYDYSKAYIIEAAERALKNFKTEYLDVLLLHRPSPLLQVDEVAEAITTLKKEGKIRDFGLSNFTPSQTELLRSKIEVNYNQIQFSVTQHDAMTDGSLDYMQKHAISPMAWNPLGTVFRENTEQTRRLKRVLVQLYEKYEVGADTLLLAWILKHPAGIRPIAGTVNVARIQQLMKASQLNLDTQDWFAIWTESLGHDVP